MGDRARIKVVGDSPLQRTVDLYTHWCGYEWRSVLAYALDANRERWDDPNYLLARVIAYMGDKLAGVCLFPEDGDEVALWDIGGKVVWEDGTPYTYGDWVERNT